MISVNYCHGQSIWVEVSCCEGRFGGLWMVYILGVFSNQHLPYQSDYAPRATVQWTFYNLRKATAVLLHSILIN